MTREERQVIMERAHVEPKFRVELMKELLRIAIKADPDLLDKALQKLAEQHK
jgi:hypothetical protein